MTRAEVFQLQRQLIAQGYRIDEDGRYGPQTAAAYAAYLERSAATTPPMVPAPDKPWWQSRAIVGTLCSIGATLAGLAGMDVDAGALTEVVLLGVTFAFSLFSLIASIRRKRPIDSTLVVPGFRLPAGTRPGPGAWAGPGPLPERVRVQPLSPARPRHPEPDPRGAFNPDGP